MLTSSSKGNAAVDDKKGDLIRGLSELQMAGVRCSIGAYSGIFKTPGVQLVMHSVAK